MSGWSGGLDRPLEKAPRWPRSQTADPARAYAWHATVGYSTRERLAEIHCPSLVLHGTRDMIIPYVAGQLLHDGLTGSEWVSFKGAGHNISVECESVFNEALLSFLQDHSH